MIPNCASARHNNFVALLLAIAMFSAPAVVLAQLTALMEDITPSPRELMVDDFTIIFSDPVVNFTLDEIYVDDPTANPVVYFDTIPGVTLTNPLADDQTYVILGLDAAYTVPGNYTFVLDADDVQRQLDGEPLSGTPTETFLILRDPIPAVIEDAAPNGGDANNDGILDSNQPHVASFPQDDDADYVTIISTLGSYFSVINHRPSDVLPGSPPPGIFFPEGVNHFTIERLPAGALRDVVVIWHSPESPIYNQYYETDVSGSFYDLYTSATFAAVGGTVEATITLEDGGNGDFGNTVNGIIDHVGGPVTEEPLAIDLIAFKAEEVPGGINVNWTTASEVDTAGFDVYRGVIDANGKLALGEKLNDTLIAGEGSVGAGSSYSVYDASPAAEGAQYYFLVELELDGDLITYGPVTPKKSQTTTSVRDWMLF